MNNCIHVDLTIESLGLRISNITVIMYNVSPNYNAVKNSTKFCEILAHSFKIVEYVWCFIFKTRSPIKAAKILSVYKACDEMKG